MSDQQNTRIATIDHGGWSGREFDAEELQPELPPAPPSVPSTRLMSANTRRQRLGMWVAYLLGGYGSPSLACLLLAPTLRWVWTGRAEHARHDGDQLERYLRAP